jgi:hypothetical protein
MRAVPPVIVLACLFACSTPAIVAAQDVTPAIAAVQDAATAPDYVGANACQSCHQAIFTSWSHTKHARTIDRLSKAEKDGGECIRCHVTGSAEQIARELGAPSHANVQCESCHGPGSLHAANAAVRTGLRKTPKASTCEACHNEKSPHFRGFVYAAMAGFSHPVAKVGP